ncbi:type I-F CRISPR-associated protein Csy1 [Ideonella aquatica]|uniref:type I-F CRISPR-associated protein Csy1 n=1 Tax=Ideonella aquatica TaxID=2824119 RepID=UPI002873A586|nr:type I-F CRISPR-associated protein Csy1 [Ideonella aquatica]
MLLKITGTDAAADKERKKQQDFYQLQSLLEKGAECVDQIQIATHILKAVHPDTKVRNATNLNVDCAGLPELPWVGSHVLGTYVDRDATGNGAFNKLVYELFRLLSVPVDGQSVLAWLKEGDADAVAALSNSAEGATKVAFKLASIDVPRCPHPSSHPLAKQLYWPVGDDPHDDTGYHLLAPLYPTSLVHRVYQTLQDDRFSEEAKSAREARKAERWHERPVREYPHLAIQKLGGTKPQNISQLNSERRGDNLLLASLPPVWRSAEVRPVLGTASLFKVYRHRPEVRRLTLLLRRFLEGDPASNQATRTQRDEWVEALLEELMLFTAEQQTLEPGWSTDPRCELPATHRVWLDPDGGTDPVPDLIDALAQDFANWLNHELRDPLPLGDPEYLHWRAQARELFKAMEREGVL